MKVKLLHVTCRTQPRVTLSTTKHKYRDQNMSVFLHHLLTMIISLWVVVGYVLKVRLSRYNVEFLTLPFRPLLTQRVRHVRGPIMLCVFCL